MLRVIALVAGCTQLGACTLWFGGDDDQLCEPTPAIAPAPLRNPDTLACDDYGGDDCDESCGCDEVAREPLPTYGACGDICETYTESQCEAAPGCRIVRDASCVYIGIETPCLDTFVGCFPTDTQQDSSIDCWNADAWTCSRSNECTAYHYISGAERSFVMCTPEGVDPGRCANTVPAVTCDEEPPSCSASNAPGVVDGCYSGGCLPSCTLF